MLQVHHEEGEIVEAVRRRQRLVELEAAEKDRLAIDQRDSAEMQIAADMMDPSGISTPRQDVP